MKKLLFLFLLGVASCGDPCNCDYPNTDPFNPNSLPKGCACSVGKIYAPFIGTDIGVDIGAEVTSTTDLQKTHKVK